MAKRVTKATAKKVAAKKPKKSLIEPENKPIKTYPPEKLPPLDEKAIAKAREDFEKFVRETDEAAAEMDKQFAEIEAEAKRDANKLRLVMFAALVLIFAVALFNWGIPDFN